MYIHGEFLTKLGEVVTVRILTKNDRNREIEIGGNDGADADIFFTDSPLTIESQVSDTFDVLQKNQATLSLEVRDFTADFFCASCFDAVVNIHKSGKCIFAGFIEPQAYSQGFNELYDKVELSCVDVLTALEYRTYKDIVTPRTPYDTAKMNAGQRSFKEIAASVLQFFTSNIDIVNGNPSKIWYDGSKAIDAKPENAYSVFAQLSIFDLLFFGDKEDSLWNADAVLEELLRYFNLHIRQDGFDFYIYSMESVKSGEQIEWRDIVTGAVAVTPAKSVDINADNVADCNTKISVGEVYSLISVKCDRKGMENIIESPLEDSRLKSPWSNAQKYMVEYDTFGKGSNSLHAFYALTHDQNTDYDAGSVISWYMQVKHNPGWAIGANGEDIVARLGKGNTNQHAIPNYIANHPCAAILSFGNIWRSADRRDNSPVSKIDMTNYLVISVNGNGKDAKDEVYPKDTDIKAAIPYAVYNGSYAGGALSPADDASTNYIVISGDIILNPHPDLSGSYKKLHDSDWDAWTAPLVEQPFRLAHRANGDNCYYTQQYFKAATPRAEEEWDKDSDRGLMPYLQDRTWQQYEFKYSAIGDSTDRISKVGVLACMLIVGDKCVVEVGHSGDISDFQWRPYKPMDKCRDEDEYYAQSFTIGFDPQIGDKLIGTSFKMQKNTNYRLGIDAEGTAIPIRRSDGVRGKVQFQILGPVNILWGEYTLRHPTFFKYAMRKDEIPLLAHVSSIFVKKFEVKIYSDNGLVNNTEDKDLIYMSAENDDFTNKKDDIEFKICSALTAAERATLGIDENISMATPTDENSHAPVVSLYNKHKKEKIKPEIDYIDSCYREYSKPRVVLTQTLIDRPGTVSPFTLYKHPALEDKRLFVQSADYDVLEGEATLTLKEIDK